MMAVPESLSEVQLLVQNQVPESLYLDYKSSAALALEKNLDISKDVSAFANSDGGLLIYGVEEDRATHLPMQIDQGVIPKQTGNG